MNKRANPTTEGGDSFVLFEHTATHVKELGSRFETDLITHTMDDPNFAFLRNISSNGHKYYKNYKIDKSSERSYHIHKFRNTVTTFLNSYCASRSAMIQKHKEDRTRLLTEILRSAPLAEGNWQPVLDKFMHQKNEEIKKKRVSMVTPIDSILSKYQTMDEQDRVACKKPVVDFVNVLEVSMNEEQLLYKESIKVEHRYQMTGVLREQRKERLKLLSDFILNLKVMTASTSKSILQLTLYAINWRAQHKEELILSDSNAPKLEFEGFKLELSEKDKDDLEALEKKTILGANDSLTHIDLSNVTRETQTNVPIPREKVGLKMRRLDPNPPSLSESVCSDLDFQVPVTKPSKPPIIAHDLPVYQSIWRGQISRQNQTLCDVIAMPTDLIPASTYLQPQSQRMQFNSFPIPSRLELDLRIPLSQLQIAKKYAIALITADPSSAGSDVLFKVHVDYFLDRKKLGIVKLDDFSICFVPTTGECFTQLFPEGYKNLGDGLVAIIYERSTPNQPAATSNPLNNPTFTSTTQSTTHTSTTHTSASSSSSHAKHLSSSTHALPPPPKVQSQPIPTTTIPNPIINLPNALTNPNSQLTTTQSFAQLLTTLAQNPQMINVFSALVQQQQQQQNTPLFNTTTTSTTTVTAEPLQTEIKVDRSPTKLTSNNLSSSQNLNASQNISTPQNLSSSSQGLPTSSSSRSLSSSTSNLSTSQNLEKPKIEAREIKETTLSKPTIKQEATVTREVKPKTSLIPRQVSHSPKITPTKEKEKEREVAKEREREREREKEKEKEKESNTPSSVPNPLSFLLQQFQQSIQKQ